MNVHDWRPADGVILEPAADRAVRELTSNILVLAGPGAGKTELLAQRACFLLQTDACPDPRRILAISFKRDAAKNIRDRVSKRCGKNLSERFDSYTFDAFSKGLVDRFRSAIPEHVRPTADYRVLTALDYKKVSAFLRDLPTQGSQLGTIARATLGTQSFYRDSFLARLEPDGWSDTNTNERGAHELWDYLVKQGTSSLSFPMIGRLAELILRTNSQLADALRSAYAFVFLDEFQDATEVNYDLVCTAFQDADARLTAVGDNKQRVMGWAGAYKRIFSAYYKDFSAVPSRLGSNYRSVRKLVLIQNVVAKALDPQAVEMTPAGLFSHDEPGECRVWLFNDEQQEAAFIAGEISSLIDGGIRPREICVLARMKTPQYSAALQSQLARLGVKSRIEDKLQDLLAEPLSEVLLAFLKLGARASDSEAWVKCIDVLDLLLPSEDERRRRIRVDEAVQFYGHLQGQLAETPVTSADARRHFRLILEFVGESRFRLAYPQYLQDEWYQEQLDALADLLGAASGDWSDAIAHVEGVDAVPIMTIHKSKGLEYHTVILLGLEDAAHWGYRGNPHEETCTFFVALSRAKCRMLFTYASSRGGNRQNRLVIKKLYETLEAAGVPVEMAG